MRLNCASLWLRSSAFTSHSLIFPCRFSICLPMDLRRVSSFSNASDRKSSINFSCFEISSFSLMILGCFGRRIMWRQARRNPIVCGTGRQNGLSDSLKSPARVKKIDQQKAARPPCPLALKSTQISHLVKVSNPPPLTFQLQRGRLADGYSEIRCNSREKTDYAGGFWWKGRKKKKSRGAV